jgi:hypothetical protein
MSFKGGERIGTLSSKFKICPGIVAHSYNPSYLVGRDQEDCGSRSTWTESLGATTSINKLGIVAHTCDSSYVGGIGRRSQSEASPEQKLETLPEK